MAKPLNWTWPPFGLGLRGIAGISGVKHNWGSLERSLCSSCSGCKLQDVYFASSRHFCGFRYTDWERCQGHWLRICPPILRAVMHYSVLTICVILHQTLKMQNSEEWIWTLQKIQESESTCSGFQFMTMLFFLLNTIIPDMRTILTLRYASTNMYIFIESKLYSIVSCNSFSSQTSIAFFLRFIDFALCTSAS